MDPNGDLIGRTFGGRFRVTGFLGEGAMARVFRGVRETDGAPVAIKVMNPELASEETVRRFRREAKAAAALRHPSTVQIFDQGAEGNLAYIVMELLEGKDLFDVLAQEGRLPEAQAVAIMIQVGEALSAAHALGIIHRDLKPENIMIVRASGDAYDVKVLDFGIAKVLVRKRAEDVSSGTSLTAAGSVVGTPEYMSPEQCEDGDVDERSDIYACGILLYRLVAGRVPFISAVALDTMLKHLREAPPPPSRFQPGLNAKLEALILRALAKEPANRPPSARAFVDELRALATELGGVPRTPTSSNQPAFDGDRTIELGPPVARPDAAVAPAADPALAGPAPPLAAADVSMQLAARSSVVPPMPVARDSAVPPNPAIPLAPGYAPPIASQGVRLGRVFFVTFSVVLALGLAVVAVLINR